MFFVGATGQVLTLILTVFLPFVFLVSAHPQAVLHHESPMIDAQITRHEITVTEYASSVSAFGCAEEFLEIEPITGSTFTEIFLQKMHPPEISVKGWLFYIESSGNKAPPVFS